MPTVHTTVTQLDDSASQGEARGHRFRMDRPQAKGGQDKGPMGGEALLLGLGGCFMSNLLAAAKARDLVLRDVKIDIAGELAQAPPRYAAIRMSVTGKCEPRDQMEKLVTIAERGCIVANTLREALDLTVECGVEC